MIGKLKIFATACAVSFILPLLPCGIVTAETNRTILSQNYEGCSVSTGEKDVHLLTSFTESRPPYAVIKNDSSHGNYAEIDASRSWNNSEKYYTDSDWVEGGYVFSEPIKGGAWTISFDFKVLSHASSFGNVSLAKTGLDSNGSELTKQFKLVNFASGAMQIAETALSGGLTPAIDAWYHYEISLNKTNDTYSATISDGTNTATANGKIGKDYSFDGIMFGRGIKVCMDNIIVTKTAQSADFVSVEYIDGAGNAQEKPNVATEAIKINFADVPDDESCRKYITVTDSNSKKVEAVGEVKKKASYYIMYFKHTLIPGMEYTLDVPIGVESEAGEKNTVAYSTTFEIADTPTLLDMKFKSTTTLEDLEYGGSAPTTGYTLDSKRGNYYLTISPNYTNYGFSLNDEIPTDGGRYKVEFDFYMESPNNTYIVALSDKNNDASRGNGVYNCFGLLGLFKENGGYFFKVGGQTLKQQIYDPDNPKQWLHYDLSFNRKSREIDLVISVKDNPDKKAELKTVLKQGSGWSDGLPADRVFSAFKFFRTGTITIDNIKVSDLADDPITIEALTDKTGNIFGGEDSKKFSLRVKNTGTTEQTAEVAYRVFDENQTEIENGTLWEVTLSGRKILERDLTVSVNKYGTYKLVFDIALKDSDGDVTDEYSTEETRFSVVNKRKDGEQLNFLTGANTERPTNIKEWTALKEVMLNAGISGMRTDLRWGDVEASAGNFTRPIFSDYYKDAVEAGIENMVILNAQNSIYQDENGEYTGKYKKWVVPTDENWQNYLKWVAEAFDGEVSYYEILNEPTEYRYNNGETLKTDYPTYAKTAKNIIQAKDSDVKVVGMSTASLQWWFIDPCLGAMKNNNPSSYMDAMTIHPYDFDEVSSGVKGEYATSLPNQYWSVKFRDKKYRDNIQTFKTKATNNNAGSIPIQATENAISSAPEICTLRAQAAELVQMYTTTAAQGIIEKLWWYSLANTTSRGSNDANPGDIEGSFGLVGNSSDSVSMAAKPAYVALAGFNKMLTGATYIDSYIIDQYNISMYRFECADGEQVVVAWREDSNDNLPLVLGADSAEVYDMYSNKIGTLNATNGVMSVTVSMEPIYLKGNFTKLGMGADTTYISGQSQKLAVGNTITLGLYDAQGRNLRMEVEASGNLSAEVNGTSVQLTAKEGARNEEPVKLLAYDGNSLVYAGILNFPVEQIKIDRMENSGGSVYSASQLADGDMTLVIYAENLTLKTNPRLYIAYYDDDDRLIYVSLKNLTIETRGAHEFEVTLENVASAHRVKLMLWDGDNIRSLCENLDYIKY